MTVLNFLSAFFAILGGMIFLIGALGLLRSEDVYCRISTVATATGFGIACFILVLVFDDFSLVNCIKALIAFLIHLAISAVSGMMIARSAYASDSKLSPKTSVDELANHQS